jgi:membrane dipeptidase
MFGVLVVVLGRDAIARLEFSLGQQSLKKGVLASVLHIEGAEAIDQNFEILDVLYEAGLRSLGSVWSRPNASGMACRSAVPLRPTRGPV